MDAVSNFLKGKGTLETLWAKFDVNKDGEIDAKEFRDLVYNSLLFFCMERNPDLPAPSRENMKPFIDKLVNQLQPYVDQNQDMNVSREEFNGYGTYLNTEYKKLMQ